MSKTIRNINDRWGDPVTFTGEDVAACIAEMLECIANCGYEGGELREGVDYEVVHDDTDTTRLGDLGTAHVWFISVGCPAGCDLIADDSESPVPDAWADLNGTIAENKWTWDGEGNPTDANANTVTNIVAFVPGSYTLAMRCEDGGTCDAFFDDIPTVDEIREELEEWIQGGAWGDNGASVSCTYDILDSSSNVIDSGGMTVEIEPNHEALITEAVGRYNLGTICGTSPDDHDWTSEGEGGCDENPGVWSTGGTSMAFKSHCRKCGLKRTEQSTGSQRNPGEHDTVEYEIPESLS